MILIVGVLSSAYFVFTLNQNTAYNDTVRQNNLLVIDRMSESINVTSQPSYSYNPSTGKVHVAVDLQNDGPINVEIKTLWLRGTNNDHYGFINVDLNLSPGESGPLNPDVSVQGAVATDKYYGWIITGRGRTIDLYPAHQTGPQGLPGTNGTTGVRGTDGTMWYTDTYSPPRSDLGVSGDFYLNKELYELYQKTGTNTWTFLVNIKGAAGDTGPIGPEGPPSATALVSQGIGSISMDFKSYNSYTVNDSGYLGTPNPAFTFSLSDRIAFSINIINLDPSHMALNLTHNGQMWLFSPDSGAIKGEVWPLANVTKNVITTLNSNQFIILPYNHTTTLYFGPYKPGGSSLGAGITAVNLVLTGKIGNVDYGQNLPFISLIATS